MSEFKDAADAVKGIVEAVPVYEDLLQPATRELSKGMLTLAKTVNMALAPFTALVWGYEKISQYVAVSMAEKLKDVPEGNIITPDPAVAGPTIEGLRFSGQNESVRELFTNLLANSMDITTAPATHPSFVEIIKQLNSDEAKLLKLISDDSIYPIVDVRGIPRENTNQFASILKNFSLLPFAAGCAHPEYGPSYMVNLQRLGLIEIGYDFTCPNKEGYSEISSHPYLNTYKQKLEQANYDLEIKPGGIKRTEFGNLFYNMCVLDK